MSKNKKSLLSTKKHIPYDYIWTKENPISFITEAYQKFLVNLEYVNVDKKYKIIQVTSAIGSEGKSTFFSNVAFLLGQKKYKTILVDLDLRKPKVHQIYNIPNTEGITDVLTQRITLEKAIKTNNEYGFDVLNSGERNNAVINLIESNRMKELFKKLSEMYDYVLVDSPPIINVSDSLYISKLTDGIVFVISQEDTKRGLVKEAVSLLKQNNVNIIGAVSTQVDLKRKRYGYSYNYSYDYSYQDNNDWYS